jgi:hypothetical protein
VIVTGDFDDWSQRTIMSRDSSTGHFKAMISLDPHRKWVFKFVVDGVWRCSLDYPSGMDHASGHVNNVIYPVAGDQGPGAAM